MSDQPRQKMILVYEIDWCASDIDARSIDAQTVANAPETSWIYSAHESEWIRRVTHCLHLAPTSDVVVSRKMMPLNEYKALPPDNPPVPETAAMQRRRKRREERKARRGRPRHETPPA